MTSQAVTLYNDSMEEKYTRLTVTSEPYIKYGKKYVDVVCDCGTKRSVQLSALELGRTKSCGCLKKEFLLANHDKFRKTHGMASNGKSQFYRIFSHINTRCSNKNSRPYRWYGARGIKNEWATFEDFQNDMYKSYLNFVSENPTKLPSIERIDFNGNYNKHNCKWIDRNEQGVNTRASKFYTNGEEKLTQASLARRYGIKPPTLSYRLNKMGLDINDALGIRKRYWKFTHDGNEEGWEDGTPAV